MLWNRFDRERVAKLRDWIQVDEMPTETTSHARRCCTVCCTGHKIPTFSQKKQNPPSAFPQVKGLNLLVGDEGFEPPTSSV